MMSSCTDGSGLNCDMCLTKSFQADRDPREPAGFSRTQSGLLGIDAVVNLILGGLLLFFPAGVLDALGLPQVSHHFYTSILGAVIFGIGLALLVDLFGAARGIHGLGLAGAITINFCGGGALLAWLIFHPFDIPVHGKVVLWSVAIVVMGIGVVELATKSWRERGRDA